MTSSIRRETHEGATWPRRAHVENSEQSLRMRDTSGFSLMMSPPSGWISHGEMHLPASRLRLAMKSPTTRCTRRAVDPESWDHGLRVVQVAAADDRSIAR